MSKRIQPKKPFNPVSSVSSATNSSPVIACTKQTLAEKQKQYEQILPACYKKDESATNTFQDLFLIISHWYNDVKLNEFEVEIGELYENIQMTMKAIKVAKGTLKTKSDFQQQQNELELKENSIIEAEKIARKLQPKRKTTDSSNKGGRPKGSEKKKSEIEKKSNNTKKNKKRNRDNDSVSDSSEDEFDEFDFESAMVADDRAAKNEEQLEKLQSSKTTKSPSKLITHLKSSASKKIHPPTYKKQKLSDKSKLNQQSNTLTSNGNGHSKSTSNKSKSSTSNSNSAKKVASSKTTNGSTRGSTRVRRQVDRGFSVSS
jgi:hypothetical protein